MAGDVVGRVTGIGGVFFKARGDNVALSDWYVEHLNLPEPVHGTVLFHWLHDDDPGHRGYTVWGPFERDTTYFGPATLPG